MVISFATIMKKSIILLSVFLFSGCDYLMVWDYSVSNNTNDSLIIEYSSNVRYDIDDAYHSSFDTILIVPPDSILKLCEKGSLGGIVSDIEIGDSISVFNSIEIRRFDSISLNENFMLRSKWKYFETHKRLGNYILQIE